MNVAIDYSTVKWVKHELDATLKQARQALEAYVENPADESQLRFCAVHLHQVYGTLQMVELYGAALLAEEMEQVTQALLDDTVGQKQEAYELVMRAILQLPDYLERLVSGGRDLPLILLPLLTLGVLGPYLSARTLEKEATGHLWQLIRQVTRNIEQAVRNTESLISMVDASARKGLIDANKAARHKSRLNARIRAL